MKHLTSVPLVGGLLAVALFGVAVAGPLEDGLTAYQRGDFATAMSLWRPLADQGNAAAQYNIGWMYYDGRAVPQDYAQAAAWYRKAAHPGDVVAQHNLGWVYYKGQNYVQAVAWYRKAADRGYTFAQYNLGLMYGYGQGVPQDYIRAHMWLNLAASRATDIATRDQAAKSRDEVAATLTPAQLAEAQRMAREWNPTK
jgi:TPR repeat protein